ncbi:MAG: glutamate 5-kinase [Pseudomonadota bacterium]
MVQSEHGKSEPQNPNNVLNEAGSIVLKIGSSLVTGEDGSPRLSWLQSLAQEIADLQTLGKQIAITSSGAVAAGRRTLGLTGTLSLSQAQACSALGQAKLIDAWAGAFAPLKLNVAQVLLTLSDTEDRRRYLNARNTLLTLLDLGVVPVINENDTVATAELRYGDNDRLAAHAGQLIDADLLLILSDIDGLYTEDPNTSPKAQHIPYLAEVDHVHEAMASGPNAQVAIGQGGMATKLAAAKIATANGCATIIASGRKGYPIRAIKEGAKATIIGGKENRGSARKRWIANRLKPTGKIKIDAGAVGALKNGASLLAAGIVEVQGDFSRGDAVLLIGSDNAPVGQGLVSYDANEIVSELSRQRTDLPSSLGAGRRAAIIDRNNLVLKD